MMEEYIKHANQANKYFRTADHLTYVTYSLLKDPKLLLSVVKTLQKATDHAVLAFLMLEKYKKNIAIPENFDLRYQLFKEYCEEKYNISKDVIRSVREIKMLVEKHEESPMEFIRQQKYIICDPRYNDINSIDVKKIKIYLQDIRQLLQKLNYGGKNV